MQYLRPVEFTFLFRKTGAFCKRLYAFDFGLRGVPNLLRN